MIVISTQWKLKSHFLGNVHVRVASMIFFFKKNMFTLNAFYQRALSVNILMYILLFSINLHSCPVLFFCKLRHGIFVSFFFFTKYTVLNGDVAKWRIIMSWDC